MKHRQKSDIVSFFSIDTFLLCLVGLLMNIAFAKLAVVLNLPLYLDNLGSMLTAVLAGPLPGMTVGFLSNLLCSFADPTALYYGTLTVIMALTAAFFSQKGWLKHLSGCFALTGLFVFFGGILGSCVTWLLYDGSLGNRISAPLVLEFLRLGIPDFGAQLLADTLIDIPDKLLTVFSICLLLRCYPKRLYNAFPLSYLYDRSEDDAERVRHNVHAHYRKHSVNVRIMSVIILCTALISISSTTVAVYFDQENQRAAYEQDVLNAAHYISSLVDGDDIIRYLSEGASSDGYQAVRQKLIDYHDRTEGLIYVYVYRIMPDGCHVVFDLDTDDTPSSAVGSVLSFDAAFLPYYDDLITGREIPAILSNGQYGALITGYYPIQDSSGVTTAYACADISVSNLLHSMLNYIIKLFSVQFAISILIIAYALWFTHSRVVAPINFIVEQSLLFDHTDPEHWLDSSAWINRLEVDTGDEIEELYYTICRVEKNVALNVQQLRKSEALELKNKELAIAIQKAEDANAAKSQFLSRMSHDIRTPINGISGMATLAMDNDNPPDTTRCLKKIQTSCGFLLGLVNDTLDMAKVESGKVELHPEPYPMEEFRDYLHSIIEPMCQQKKLTLVFHPSNGAEDLVPLMDKLRINQIFFNLLSNAVKFTPEGGTITIVTHSKPISAGRIHYDASVSDTGIGMSETFQQHMFETFTQEEQTILPQRQGSGLGLSIVKAMLELMGGEITVDSKLHQGSCFRFHMDLDSVPAASVHAASPMLNDWSILQGKTVLLVEDHPLNQEIAMRLLQKQGVIVIAAENGKRALDLFASSDIHRFDAILMDIRMPVMDGLTATQEIRKLLRPDALTIPIIAMTANAFADDISNCLQAGMNSHIAKPISPDALYSTLAVQLQK